MLLLLVHSTEVGIPALLRGLLAGGKAGAVHELLAKPRDDGVGVTAKVAVCDDFRDSFSSRTGKIRLPDLKDLKDLKDRDLQESRAFLQTKFQCPPFVGV